MDRIAQIEALLEETARRCLRLIITRTLTRRQTRALAKWMFGCMNQRWTIRKRVEMRGEGELTKVLLFTAKAAEVLLEIDESSQPT